MLSALIRSTRSYPAVLLAEQLVHQRCVHPGPLVLRTAPLKLPTPTTDRDRTVSRRSEPSSRTALMGEQPNPWDRLQPQDAMSRHRGAKPPRRCELLGEISLLSPGSLLSVESSEPATSALPCPHRRSSVLKLPAPTTDRDRTVSRRSEPSSRTALMGEQPNPWDRLQPQDAMSRHRGAKPPRRCELLGEISLLSPG